MIDVIQLIYLGSGRNRDVYLLPSGRNVIKVPRNDNGTADNQWEYYYRNHLDPWEKKHKVYARCRMIGSSNLLVMEYIKPSLTGEIRCLLGSVPLWVGCIDCGQVGFNRRGKLKAYDYGLT